MSKLKKLFYTPHLYLRDALNKRFPPLYSELNKELNYLQFIQASNDEIEKRDFDFANNSQEVDAVITWVNNNDADWISKYNKYVVSCGNSEILSPRALDPARFENHNEIMYSITSIIKYLPWIRNIWIVTDGQKPNWLNDDLLILGKRINIVDHKDIIDQRFLPTFNSHVIEANIYKIKGLAKRFIYFNDDVFVGRQLAKSHFFTSNNLTSLFVTNKPSTVHEKANRTATTFATENSLRIIKKEFNVSCPFALQHTYIPIDKEVFRQVVYKYRKEIEEFQTNRFRSTNDINVATFLVPYWTYLVGKSKIVQDVCFYFNCRSNHGVSQMKFLLGSKDYFRPDSICANDFEVKVNTNELFLSHFFEEYFSEIRK